MSNGLMTQIDELWPNIKTLIPKRLIIGVAICLKPKERK
jgi:hypothetical protein